MFLADFPHDDIDRSGSGFESAIGLVGVDCGGRLAVELFEFFKADVAIAVAGYLREFGLGVGEYFE